MRTHRAKMVTMKERRQVVEEEEDGDDGNTQISAFTRFVEAHPYGVLPSGNGLLSLDQQNQSACFSSSSSLLLLGDETWLDILSFCDGVSLSRVVQTSRRMYVLGHIPELWRDLVLRLQRDLVEMGTCCWKDTYVKMMMTGAAALQDNASFPWHRPMSVPGVYSDYLFRTHLCRSFAIPPHWWQVEGSTSNQHGYCSTLVPRVEEKLSAEEFVKMYEQPNLPVVLAGAAKSWPATQQWCDLQYLIAKQESQSQQQQPRPTPTTLRATSGAAPLSAQFSLKAYLDYCCKFDNIEEAPLYLFDRTALLSPPPTTPTQQTQSKPSACLQDDYLPHLQESCPFWDIHQYSGHDLFSLLGEGRRPDHTWLIMGPRRSGSVFHIDPNATHAWNANLLGKKRWIFYPPGNPPPPGVYPSSDGDEVTLPLSIGEWLLNYYESEHADRMMIKTKHHHHHHRHHRPMECTVEAGDIVFVPHGWWHMVVNLEEVNMAITHNYVSRSNLANVLRFLNTRFDQISGCRDRSESIKPDALYSEFVGALQAKHPQWLERALAVPDWTCRAWHHDNAQGGGGGTCARLHQSRRQQSIRPRSCNNGLASANQHAPPSKRQRRLQPDDDDEAKQLILANTNSSSGGGDGTTIVKNYNPHNSFNAEDVPNDNSTDPVAQDFRFCFL